jgi:hypothetical protein
MKMQQMLEHLLASQEQMMASRIANRGFMKQMMAKMERKVTGRNGSHPSKNKSQTRGNAGQNARKYTSYARSIQFWPSRNEIHSLCILVCVEGDHPV